MTTSPETCPECGTTPITGTHWRYSVLLGRTIHVTPEETP